MRTCTHATNSATRRMYCAADPASTTTRNSAACTTLFERTTPIAAPAIATAMIQKATSCSHMALLLLALLGTELQGLGLGHGGHPLAELHLVVEHPGDVALRVLVLGTPEQGVERAHLDADPAVHAEGVVDVEAVEHAYRTLAPALAARRALLLVTLDVDAPVGALARAQHAHRAVLFLECDDAARAGDRVFLLVGVLHGDRGLQHRLERDAEAADHARELLAGHQIATFNTPVS